MLDIASVTSRDDKIIVFRDQVDAVLLEIEADNATNMEKFLEALQAAQEHLIPELQGQKTRQDKATQRRREMEGRQRERERRKAALGPVGMTATAKIMMRNQ